MTCCIGESERAKAIARALRKAHGESQREIKILLLGTGECGKSTIVKQMKILYGTGFDEATRLEFRGLVFRNLLRSMKALIDAMDMFGGEIEDEALASQAFDLLEIEDVDYTDFAPHLKLFTTLWSHPAIQSAYGRRNEFVLSDSTQYFMDRMSEIAESDFMPNDQDILRARQPTTGIHEYTFQSDKAMFRFVTRAAVFVKKYNLHP
eukprot:m.21695 g.21695  ORF g.21695 m.21695 type:complete len:207 (-) comp8323_c0_seq1:488-1108(-)